jgi:hypothetical protein
VLSFEFGLAPLGAIEVAAITANKIWLLPHRRMEQHEAHGTEYGSLNSGRNGRHVTGELGTLW